MSSLLSKQPFSNLKKSYGAYLVGFPGGLDSQDCPHCERPGLVWEDPLEEEVATDSRILAWKIPSGLQSTGSQGVGQNGATLSHTHMELILERIEDDFLFIGLTRSLTLILPPCDAWDAA